MMSTRLKADSADTGWIVKTAAISKNNAGR
jgi:hypothetical protein